jgi:hypothetical protein
MRFTDWRQLGNGALVGHRSGCRDQAPIDCPYCCVALVARSSKGKAGGQGGRNGGGGSRRSYARDNRGRFASTGATARGGRLATASGNKRATQTTRIAGGGKGVISANRKPSAKPIAVAPSTGANNIRRLSKSDTGHPRALRANAVRTYKPRTPEGRAAKIVRRIQSVAGESDASLKGRVRKVLDEHDKLTHKINNRHARDMADRTRTDVRGRIAGIHGRNSLGFMNRGARDIIQARAARATAAAARGSKPAARAQEIYANQLAFTGSGKAAKGSNNIQPGRGNTRPPKPRRRRK